MHRRFLILFCTFWLCVLGYFLVLRGHSVAPAKPVVTAAPEPVDEEANLRALEAEERQTQAHVETLASLEAKRNLRDESAQHIYFARRQLQVLKAEAWSSILSTNSQAFAALRRQADGSPDGDAHCTICDGSGSMELCILCENSGKCASCKGTGKGYYVEICPACMGSGKCYLCSGSGRMACPYCDDGTISSKVAPPPSSLPLLCDPVPDQETLVADATSSELESAEAVEAQKLAEEQGPQTTALPPSSYTRNGLTLAVGLLLAGAVLAIRKTATLPKTRSAQQLLQTLLAEDTSLAGFFAQLRAGLNASPHYQVSEALDSLNGVRPQTDADESSAAAYPLREFFASAPSRLAGLRTLLSEITRASDETARQNVLLEFHRQVSDLKELAQPPEVRPFGLMAYALAGLLKQLASNASEVTPSTLRTVAGAVDLLEILCVPGLNPNLASEPPVRLLAVDDDAVSRRAISFALKKAFNEPDLAPDGEAALGLIARQSYDVIFLDVDMPGMDGFELCTKIRQTVCHRTTPVVFVTRHSDFNSRAKSTLSGGQDLIGKPFLAFEITVKALTLALRGRLQNGTTESDFSSEAASNLTALAIATADSAAMAAPSVENLAARTEAQENRESEPVHPNGHNVPPASDPSGEDFAKAFRDRASVHIEELRTRLRAAQQATQPAALQEFVSGLFLGIHSLSLESERAELRAVHRLAFTLEGMLKKLVAHPKLCTASTLNTAAAALDLLDDLCWSGAKPDLANPPVRLLVVDDDPVACRAVCGSLQLAFGRPDSADSGEAALALAAEKSFDLIFLDVLMPGMDGFTTCRKIHEAGLNPGTPVVFVTGYDDIHSRTQAAVSGGCGLIPKPVLASQITLTALTFILRARFNQSAPATATEEKPCLEMA